MDDRVKWLRGRGNQWGRRREESVAEAKRFEIPEREVWEDL
jgi:hypothetical protein